MHWGHIGFFVVLLQHNPPCPVIYLGEMFVRPPRSCAVAELLVGDVVPAYVLPFPPHLQDEPPRGRVDGKDVFEKTFPSLLMLRPREEDFEKYFSFLERRFRPSPRPFYEIDRG